MDLMSTAQLLGNFGEFFGAIAVVVTLGYLAAQIRQNTRASQADAIQSVIESHRATLRLTVEHPDINDLANRGYHSYGALSDSEKFRFSSFVIDFGMQAQATMELFNRGLISSDDYDVWIGFVASILRTPGGAMLWKEVQHYFTLSIRDVLNERIAADKEEPDFIGNVSYLQGDRGTQLD